MQMVSIFLLLLTLQKKITKGDFLTAQEADMSINSKRMSNVFKFDELERRNGNFF